MLRSIFAFLTAAVITANVAAAAEPKKVVFEGKVSETKWMLQELGDLPKDWTPFESLTLDMKATSPQRFELRIHTADGVRKIHLHPLEGARVRASIPLKYLKGVDRDGMDLASLGNKPRWSYWINLMGQYGPLKDVKAVSVAMLAPIGTPTLEIYSVHLDKDAPGDALLEPKQVVDEFGQWMLADWPNKAKTLDELKTAWTEEEKNLAPGDFGYDKFGGYKAVQLKATGFFRVEDVDGRWWFVDPEGHPFFSAGADCMAPWSITRVQYREGIFTALPPDTLKPEIPKEEIPEGKDAKTIEREIRRWLSGKSFYTWNLSRRFGAEWESKWADMQFRRMQAWGFNTVANWSDRQLLNAGRAPYVVMMRGWGMDSETMGMPDVYDQGFEKKIDEAARKDCERRKNDPYLIGYFVANEPPWAGRELDVVDSILAGKPTATQKTLKEYLAKDDSKKSRKEFVYLAFEKFINTVNAAIKKNDPNHLNLGMRFGSETPDRMIEASRGFDVFSINSYGYEADKKFIDRAYKITGKPVVIGEFHFGTPGRGMAPGLLQTRDQTERGVAYRYYVENAAAHPAMIGAHWFQWTDEPNTGRADGENYNIGMVDVTDRPYKELTDAVTATSKRLYDVHAGKIAPFDQKAKVQ